MNNSTTHMFDGTERTAIAVRARGVAMLLVLIALSVGTVLAAASLTSRDNSPAIGRNAGLVAASNWAADAGASYATAVLETSAPWRSARGGVILQGYPMSGVRVDVVVTNLAGNPPAIGDREVIITSTATVEGVVSVEERRVSLSLPSAVFQPIDPFISEFAIFANESLKIEPGARIRTFANSPESSTLVPIKIGTGFSAAADLILDLEAILHGVQFILDSAGSMALEQMVEAAANTHSPEQLPLEVPAIPADLPSQFDSLEDITTKGLEILEGAGYSQWNPVLGLVSPLPDLVPARIPSGLFSFRASGSLQRAAVLAVASGMIAQTEASDPIATDSQQAREAYLEALQRFFENLRKQRNENWNWNWSGNGSDWIYSSSTTLPRSGRYSELHISSRAELTIDATNGRFYKVRDLTLDSEAVLLIRGDVVLHVEGNVLVTQGSTMEFADEASSLAIYIGGDLFVDDSALGVDRSLGLDRARHYSKLTRYTRPQRLRLIALSPGSGGSDKPRFDIETNSLVLGCIHAPHAKVKVRDASALIGQVVARKFNLKRDSALLYDPRMDSRAGYSSRLGPIYSDGNTVTAIDQILTQAASGDGAWTISRQVNVALSNAWVGSADWTIETDDSSVADPQTYYGGHIVYGPDPTGLTPTPPTPPTTPQQTAPLIPDPGFQMPAVNVPALTEDDVMNTGNTPTRRTPGRVRASRVSRRRGSGS